MSGERPCIECGRGVAPETMAEITRERARLARLGSATTAARMSLIERVREFVNERSRHGSKTGRPDYSVMVRLDEIEPLRIALDEYDRVRAPRETDQRPTEERGST